MKYVWKIIVGLGCAALISACSTFQSGSEQVEKSKASELIAGNYEKVQTGLSPKSLPPGECGLFLWSKSETPDFVFYSRAGSETADFWYEKQERKLTRTGVSGEVFGQQLTRQLFTLEDGRAVALEMTPGELLVGGQRVPQASFKITDAEGWVTMMPAVGASVCQPAV